MLILLEYGSLEEDNIPGSKQRDEFSEGDTSTPFLQWWPRS